MTQKQRQNRLMRSYLNTTDRKIIITANYRIDTKNLKGSVKSFTDKVNEIGGYIESSDITLSYAYFTFRIPADKLDSFFVFAEESGKVTYSSQKGKDVTIEYHDTQAELKALKVKEERLLSLLESASSLDNILAIEKQLNEVRISIEKITTRLNELNNLINYATVNIKLNNIEESKKASFGELITKAFTSSINLGVNLVKYLCVIIVFLAPYILVIALIVFIIIFIRKKKQDKFNKKNL